MKTATDARRRILRHFLLGIALPGVLLGYLAFRGIQNDRALVERERLNEQQRIAERINEDAEGLLDRLGLEAKRNAKLNQARVRFRPAFPRCRLHPVAG